MTENGFGAMFEILVDGKPRSYRDTKLTAMGAAQFLKSRTPHSEEVLPLSEAQGSPPGWLRP